MKKICVVTSSRADYGLLKNIFMEINGSNTLSLQLVAPCAHMSRQFGETIRVIGEDGYKIKACVDMLLHADTPEGITKSMGMGLIGFADTLQKLQPDLLLVVGDHQKIFVCVSAALIAALPIAHIYCGKIPEEA